MTFNSYLFILVFLPVFLLLYLGAGARSGRFRRRVIIAGGAVFYLYAGWENAAVLAVSLVVNYLLALAVAARPGRRKYLALAVIFNVAALFCFKYLNFALESVRMLTHGDGRPLNLILPLGISFFSFQQIMYVSAVFRGEIQVGLTDYLCYILFFPKLIMGPLAEPAELISQFHDPARGRVDWGNLACGLRMFSLGLCKKALLADSLARGVTWLFANSAAATSYDLILGMLCYTFQIYFDFSGYSDMALGIAKMMNLDLPMNFNAPYQAVSIRDFWRRWHMSLTAFLTKYIYIPLGGSRKGAARTYANIMIVFLVSGLWHGANWTYLLWGALHGLLQVMERAGDRFLQKVPRVIRWGLTFLCVNLLWLLFRADSVGQWMGMLQNLFSFRWRIISDQFIAAFRFPEIHFLLDKLGLARLETGVRGFYTLLLLAASFLLCLLPKRKTQNPEKMGWGRLALCVLLFIWGFLCIGGESTFLYFGF